MATKYDLVALLPMKANSERVKGKNFREFAGKPLFKWMLDALVEVNEIDCIIINTDARHILEANGLKECSRIRIRERKSELCGDFVSMNKIIEDDILNVESGDYLMTHTTHPLISPQTIRSAITEYKEGTAKGKDSLFSVNRYQTRFYKKNGTPINHDPDNLIRTQDLEPWYEENSNLYLFSKDSFFSANARIGTKPILFETPTTESQDIDNKIDWRTAEILALAGMLANSHTEG
ncbi:MAG: acylneuraminate cytidylyltransferase family protein [Opitutaceae bacterium]|nr:acylneuraminate cytidylyltransferase family protein [Opitutaceae bacterium]